MGFSNRVGTEPLVNGALDGIRVSRDEESKHRNLRLWIVAIVNGAFGGAQFIPCELAQPLKPCFPRAVVAQLVSRDCEWDRARIGAIPWHGRLAYCNSRATGAKRSTA